MTMMMAVVVVVVAVAHVGVDLSGEACMALCHLGVRPARQPPIRPAGVVELVPILRARRVFIHANARLKHM